MSNHLLFVALIVAALDWYAEAIKNPHLIYFTKPVTMLLVLAWYWQNVDRQAAPYWFLIGGVLS